MEIFLLCLAFVALPFALWGLAELFRAYILPPKRVEAVLRKKDSSAVEGFSGEKKKKFILLFEADGVKHRFTVTQEQFAVSRPGARGTLTYRGRRFISFN